MDRRYWMYLEDRFCKEYIDGVKSFIETASQNLSSTNQAHCSRQDCENIRIYNVDKIERHLYKNGFAGNYKRWIFHGEEYEHSKEKSRDNLYVMFDGNTFEHEDLPVSNYVHGPTSSTTLMMI